MSFDITSVPNFTFLNGFKFKTVNLCVFFRFQGQPRNTQIVYFIELLYLCDGFTGTLSQTTLPLLEVLSNISHEEFSPSVAV